VSHPNIDISWCTVAPFSAARAALALRTPCAEQWGEPGLVAPVPEPVPKPVGRKWFAVLRDQIRAGTDDRRRFEGLFRPRGDRE
jgi:hypothetical protein